MLHHVRVARVLMGCPKVCGPCRGLSLCHGGGTCRSASVRSLPGCGLEPVIVEHCLQHGRQAWHAAGCIPGQEMELTSTPIFPSLSVSSLPSCPSLPPPRVLSPPRGTSHPPGEHRPHPSVQRFAAEAPRSHPALSSVLARCLFHPMSEFTHRANAEEKQQGRGGFRPLAPRRLAENTL